MYATFNRFEIEMTLKDARKASHAACSDTVNAVSKLPKIRRQLAKISNEDLKAELEEYGAWDDIKLSSRFDNEQRIVWLAAGNITEEAAQKK